MRKNEPTRDHCSLATACEWPGDGTINWEIWQDTRTDDWIQHPRYYLVGKGRDGWSCIRAGGDLKALETQLFAKQRVEFQKARHRQERAAIHAEEDRKLAAYRKTVEWGAF